MTANAPSNLIRRSALAAAALVVCLLASLLSAGPAGAAGSCPGANGRIAVVSAAAGGDELGLLTPAGRFHRLYRVRSEPRRGVARTITDPTFSCDGRWIAFTERGASPRAVLVVVNVAGRGARVVPTQHRYGEHPSFLRDGRIVFSSLTVRKVPGSNVSKAHPGGTFVVARDGSGFRRLFSRRELAASPDGRFFVATDPGGSARTLQLVGARGAFVRRLLPPAPAGTEYLDPAFSPDGRRVVFAKHTARTPFSVLFLVRRDGTGLRRLTTGANAAAHPAFSPDGRWIAFTRSRGEGLAGTVYALSVQQPGKLRKLSVGTYKAAAWSPR